MACQGRRTEKVRAKPWSSRQWVAYYRANAQNLLSLPWKEGAGLTDSERAAVASSIQDFQLGESSEGRNLLQRAREHAAAEYDAAYGHAMQLFIREEQRHARDLGSFLMLADIPLVEHTKLDTIFRRLRRLAGLEQMLMVLLTAETIGKVYYKALRAATGSVLLKKICDQLLRDEVRHMRFHAERLARLRRHRSGWRLRLTLAWQRLLFGGSCIVVWAKHRSAFRAGGLGYRAYWRECWREMNRLQAQMDPARYDFAHADHATVENRRVDVFEPAA
jgi:hypothetical protein